ncbi:MAG: LysM peptidoglycan-binding domain-containing protein [Desulfobacteraceae bacterium]|nr:MAG: LysM peptidoglycan-binding domain-containing protein [Desulfobacteraceae bacterium]
MKIIARIIAIVLLIALVFGCGKSAFKSPKQIASQHMAKAEEYEAKGDLVEALEQYKLLLMVDPENQLAQDKGHEIEQELRKLAANHFQTGLTYHRKGQYTQARKELLTALRYYPEHPEAKKMLTAHKELEQVNRYILHTIQPDESISTLAERYYGDFKKFHLIAQFNELEDATKVTVGQEIKIPVIEGVPIVADPTDIRTDSRESPEAMPGEIITVKGFITHTVQPGESLSELAKIYYGDYKKFDLIVKFNGLEDITSVRVAQEIKIPEIEGVPFLVKKKGEEKLEASIPKDLSEPKEMPEKEKIAEPKIEKEELTIEDQAANYRALGIELFNNKNYEDSIIEFQKVLNVNSYDKVAINYLSLAHFEQGVRLFKKEDYLKAIKKFEASHQYNKDCENCEKYIKKSMETFNDVHYRNGLTYFKEEKLVEAIQEWELVYEMNPKYKDVERNLKKARTLLKRLESIKRSKTQEKKK